MPNEYDISKAFKRIENDLMESMMRNLKRHQVEEKEQGMTWEQWQAIQLRELEEYRLRNADKFTDDFRQIDRKVDALYRNTSQNAQAKEEARILEKIKKRQFTPDKDKGGFFNLNEGKLEALIMATKSDFARAEFAMLRRANDQYRQIIFDSMVYANVTNDYAKAVDMATHDFLKRGINSVVYKNGARHTVADYARMALRTGNKRAYLMGEGNAHDKYGLHVVRVNNRTDACPLCVGFLGKLLIDDVYAGGTQAEADQMGIPTLSDAMLSGFLHPNCKDMYSVYIEGVSKPAKPWNAEEIEQITEDYNTEQKIKYAQDTADTYQRMAKYSLDPDNVAKYEAKAKEWQAKVEELKGNKPIEPATPPVAKAVAPLTDEQKEALEWYVSGDGMWVNQYMRGNMQGYVIDDTEKELLELLKTATDRPLEADKLYRSVDASVIFSGMSDDDLYHMLDHIMYGEGQYDKGAYSQGIKARMEKALEEAKGREITDKGFMSTTVDKDVAIEWGGFTGADHPVVIEFDTAGAQLRGVDLDFLDIAEDPQRERLLAPNVHYKVTDIGVAETEEGVRYVKIKATIIDQGEAVIQEAIEQVVEPSATPEQEIRQRIADIKAKGVDKMLSEAQAEKDRLTEYYNAYGNLSIGAQASGKDMAEYIGERIAKVEAYENEAYRNSLIEKYRYIADHLQEFENGTHADEVTARIKELKKQEKVWRKELDAEYKALEGVIGEPNVKQLEPYKEKNTTRIKQFLDDAPKKCRDVWNEFADNFRVLPGRGNKAYYSPTQNGVSLSINSASKGSTIETPYQVVFHEYGHSIDYELNRRYGNGNRMQAFTEQYRDGIFGKTVQREANEAIEKFAIENGLVSTPNKGSVVQQADNMVRRGLLRAEEKAEYIRTQMQTVQVDRIEAEKRFCEHIKGKYELLHRSDISDMFESVMKTQSYPFGAGHGAKYWGAEKWKRCGKEAFAEMYSATIANEGSWAVIQEFFPESVKIFDEILEVTKL